jgi:predicted DNA-binding transcriptional regulator AlpA
MVIEIDGVEYATAADINREIGITRQTLWRWRKSGKIPRGRRYRGYQVVFTRQEVDAIREFANRLEPADPARPSHRSKRFKGKLAKRTV